MKVIQPALAVPLLFAAMSSAQTAPTDGEIPTPPWDWTENEVRSAVNQVRAGRDLTPESWPGGARVARMVCTLDSKKDGSIAPCCA